MYGPPPDPRELPVEAPLYAWVACVLIGLGLAAWARPARRAAFVAGMTLALTAPAAWMTTQAVWGAWPTVDKAGSLLFYLRGVHRLADLDALRLIGVHVGHLWLTAAFDLVFEPFAAQNAHALLNVGLSWYCAARLFEALGAPRLAALGAALPFGLGLHVFRDIQWYTIEKSGLWWLPLYALALLRRPALAPLVYVGAFFYNVYWGVLLALVGAAALPWRPRAVIASALAALPLLYAQWRLMHGEDSLGDPAAFAARAALDSWSPLWWNRLEAWRALDPAALALGLWGLRRRPEAALFVALTAALALGPVSPFYQAFAALPGMWRFAKPEVFFELSWLVLLGVAALEGRRWLLGATLAFFLVSTRTHPVYPGFSTYVELRLAPGWKQAVPGMDGAPQERRP